jgi:hypothetical protein
VDEREDDDGEEAEEESVYRYARDCCTVGTTTMNNERNRWHR